MIFIATAGIYYRQFFYLHIIDLIFFNIFHEVVNYNNNISFVSLSL